VHGSSTMDGKSAFPARASTFPAPVTSSP
jgi:hypothetical protein